MSRKKKRVSKVLPTQEEKASYLQLKAREPEDIEGIAMDALLFGTAYIKVKT